MVKLGPMAKASTSKESRLGPADWERAALAAIAAGGIEAVAVEPLARTLGVTKGSFYWHFANRDALLAAALVRWEAEHTEGIIAALAKVKDPRQRLVNLLAEAAMSDEGARFHTALAASADHPVVAPALARVTARRIGYLEQAFRDLGFSPRRARHRAMLAYASYLGLVQLHRELPAELPRGRARREYLRHVIATLLA